MRLVFMGSPDFALPSLRRLSQAYVVAGVVTQPDRPAGRGRQPRPPPVKTLALELGLPVIQPERLREPGVIERLRAWAPDLIVVAAYGQILRPPILDLPSHGCVNVHASLLPRWRGAAPIQAAIAAGDVQTGISLMAMDAGLDTGPILAQRAFALRGDETGGELTQRLADLGADLLAECLPPYLDGALQAKPQDEPQATYAPLLKKHDGLLRFDQPAETLARRVRAYDPWPGCFAVWRGGHLGVLRAHAAAGLAAPMGAVVEAEGAPAVVTSEGMLVLDAVQPAGKRPMSGPDFLRGAPGFVGTRFAP